MGVGRVVNVDVGGSPMDIYVSEPSGQGPFPAVLEMHHREGVDAFTQKFCDDLAEQGYIAAAPNLFHRQAGEDLTQYRKFINDRDLLTDISASVDYLKSRGDVRADRIGLIGHCMGGHVAWLGGLTLPVFRALVVYYGGDIKKGWGEGGKAPLDLATNASCPIIGFFGKDDQNPSPADMAEFSAALDAHGKRHEFHSYAAAGHAFQNYLREEYFRPEPAGDSWDKMLAFLERELRP
jgi:carboxymethylenebutenolidase